MSPGSRKLSGSPRRRAKNSKLASKAQLAKIHVQREESEARGAAPTAERRAPGRKLDDGLEPSDRTDGDGLEPRRLERELEPLDFQKLERKELEPPFTPRAGRVPNVPDQNLVKKFGPHRPSDGDSPQQKGGSDEVSLSFKGEQFQGFSVFASPAPPVRRKSSKDLK